MGLCPPLGNDYGLCVSLRTRLTFVSQTADDLWLRLDIPLATVDGRQVNLGQFAVASKENSLDTFMASVAQTVDPKTAYEGPVSGVRGALHTRYA